jgi:hypothetical protein
MAAANTSLPRGVVAPETGSVAMKKAHSMLPPASRWNAGLACCDGSIAHAMPDTSARVPMKATGMCQVMMRSASSSRPPAAHASATHSQPAPAKLPKAGDCSTAATSPSPRSPVRSASSGVAPVMPSSARSPPNTHCSCVAASLPCNPGHCDISAGKLTISRQ